MGGTFFVCLFDVHRHIQYKAQKQHRGDILLRGCCYGNSSVLFECLMVEGVKRSNQKFIDKKIVVCTGLLELFCSEMQGLAECNVNLRTFPKSPLNNDFL